MDLTTTNLIVGGVGALILFVLQKFKVIPPTTPTPDQSSPVPVPTPGPAPVPAPGPAPVPVPSPALPDADRPVMAFLMWLLAYKAGNIKMDDHDREAIRLIRQALPDDQPQAK